MPILSKSMSLAERTLSALAAIHPSLASWRDARDALALLGLPGYFEGGRVGIVDKGVYDALRQFSGKALHRAGIELAAPGGIAGAWDIHQKMGHAMLEEARYVLVPVSEAIQDVEIYVLATILCNGGDILLVDDDAAATAEASLHMEVVLKSDDFEPMRARLGEPDPRRVVDLRAGRA